jgi:hypothetical protein
LFSLDGLNPASNRRSVDSSGLNHRKPPALAVVVAHDCYPFVHTGFVEQFLWRRSVTRREFAPRLALKALQMVARDLPVIRPAEGGGYWDGLRGWVEQALGWM